VRKPPRRPQRAKSPPHRQTASRHRPDLAAPLSPQREATTRAARYAYLDHRTPPVVRAPGCWSTAGASLLSAPLPAERAMGAKKRRHKGSARAYERRKVFAEGETRRAVRRSLAELSERPLRGRLPVLRWCPLRASCHLEFGSQACSARVTRVCWWSRSGGRQPAGSYEITPTATGWFRGGGRGACGAACAPSHRVPSLVQAASGSLSLLCTQLTAEICSRVWALQGCAGVRWARPG
jgi:hypothetical protein